MEAIQTLTQSDLAKRWHVSEQAIGQWRRNGRIPRPIMSPKKHGRVWDVAAIEAFEAESEAIDEQVSVFQTVEALPGVSNELRQFVRDAATLATDPMVPTKSGVMICQIAAALLERTRTSNLGELRAGQIMVLHVPTDGDLREAFNQFRKLVGAFIDALGGDVSFKDLYTPEHRSTIRNLIAWLFAGRPWGSEK